MTKASMRALERVDAHSIGPHVTTTLARLGEDLDGSRGSVELPRTVVGYPDAVNALPHGLGGIFSGHDTLNDDLGEKHSN